MDILQKDRRKTSLEGPAAFGQLLEHDIVEEGVRLQECVGTVGAIEYLKSHGIRGAVIASVLSGHLPVTKPN